MPASDRETTGEAIERAVLVCPPEVAVYVPLHIEQWNNHLRRDIALYKDWIAAREAAYQATLQLATDKADRKKLMDDWKLNEWNQKDIKIRDLIEDLARGNMHDVHTAYQQLITDTKIVDDNAFRRRIQTSANEHTMEAFAKLEKAWVLTVAKVKALQNQIDHQVAESSGYIAPSESDESMKSTSVTEGEMPMHKNRQQRHRYNLRPRRKPSQSTKRQY